MHAAWLGGHGRPVGAQSVRGSHTRTMAAAHCMTGARTQEGVQCISDANIRHGRQTKGKLAVQRHAAQVGRRVRGELKRIESQLVDVRLLPDN